MEMRERRETDREDRDCLRRLAAGHADALELLHDRHAPAAFRLALWTTRCREDAEDAVQSAFVRLASLGAELLRIRRPGVYLLAIVRNEAVRAARRRTREGARRVEADDLLAPEADPAREAERHTWAGRLDSLSDVQREVVLLHLFEGLSFREIGKVTGVATFTAASRYRLAIGRLRRGAEER